MTPVAAQTAPSGVQSGPIRVSRLEGADVARWDAFVAECPEATFFHRAAWKDIVERTFGHRPYFLYAECGGKIQGILPLGYVRSLFFGNALISVPFCVYGGLATTTQSAMDALEHAAKQVAADLRVDYLELRHRGARKTRLQSKDLYVTFRKQIDPDPEVNMCAIPRKQRAMVRKGIRSGLVSEIDQGVDRFYSLYSESVRNLGTPVMPKRWFRLINEVFDDECEVLTVTKDGRPMSSVMSFYFRDEVLPYYGGGGSEARALKANDFMYWELMRRAGTRGVRLFDYGRSKKDTGSYHFKKNWGFEPEPLHYEYYLVRAKQVPDINPLNPKYRMFVNLWQRMPLSLSRVLGPMVSRSLA